MSEFTETKLNSNKNSYLRGIENFESQGFFEAPYFLASEEVCSLRKEIQKLKDQNKFRSSRIGSTKILEKQIRSDEICWIDEAMTSESSALQNYFLKTEALKKYLNEKYFLGLKSLESHFAIYQAGEFYQRHLDATSDLSRRKLSLICYLNSDWQTHHGGKLRIYLSHAPNDQLATEYVDIDPAGGKLVGFLSHELEHEVLKSSCERMSLTSWFLS